MVVQIDSRIVYGVRCTWWGTVYEAGQTALGLPGCPHCRGSLAELDDIDEWWAGVDRFEAEGHPGYRELVEWVRGRCIPQVPGVPTIDLIRNAKWAEEFADGNPD